MDTISLSLRLRFIVLAGGFVSTAATAFWAFSSGWATDPREVFSIVSAGIAITALVYAAMSFHFATSIRLEELRIKRVEHATALLAYSATPDMVHAIRVLTEVRREVQGKEPAELVKVLESDPLRTEAIVLVFNHFERLGIVVRHHAADENVLKEYYAVPVRRLWFMFHPWVEARRTEAQSSDIYCELQHLAERWK